jgi:hypothetical protein
MLREDSPPSRLCGRSREACPPSTRHGTATTTLRVRAPPVWRLESCTTPPPWPALAMLSVARRLSASAKEAASLLPWWCQPLQISNLRGPFARAALLAVSGRKARKCVIANHPAMIATSRLALLSRALRPLRYGVLAHAHNGRAVSRVSDSSSQRRPASRGFTNHSTSTIAGSLASIHQPDRAGRGSTISCCARACQAYSKLCPCNMQCNMPLAGIYHVSNQHFSQSASLSHLRCSRSELFHHRASGK